MIEPTKVELLAIQVSELSETLLNITVVLNRIMDNQNNLNNRLEKLEKEGE